MIIYSERPALIMKIFFHICDETDQFFSRMFRYFEFCKICLAPRFRAKHFHATLIIWVNKLPIDNERQKA